MLSGLVGVATPAQANQPDFQMPFPCGEKWRASTYSGHDAIDWNAYPDDNGRAVVASAAGTASLEYQPAYGGYMVNIDHGGGWRTVYAHLQPGGRASGQVASGQVIGYVGSTGSSSAPHLHWAQTLNGVAQVPLYADGVALNPGWSANQTAPEYTSNNCGGTPEEESTSADFNQDGKSDIAWLTSSGTVNALLSTGTSFTTSGLAAGYANPTWAGVGNFNADNRGDIALYQASNQTLYLLKGDSSGTWSAGPVLTNLAEPAWAGVGDFNRDGLDDLAWYTSQNGGTITALLSTGTSFTSSVIATGYASPTWAGTGDFNGDGRGDIAWYQESNQTLYLLKANDAGQWSAGAVVTGLSKPKWAGTGDFTRDGKTDIAWYRSSGGTITILVATATSFNSSPLVTGYAIPTWAGTGDYNGDGRDDIAWYQSNQTLYLLKANNAGTWAAGPVMTGLAPPIWAGNGSPPIS